MNWKKEAQRVITDLIERMDELDSIIIDLQGKLDNDDKAGFVLLAETVEEG